MNVVIENNDTDHDAHAEELRLLILELAPIIAARQTTAIRIIQLPPSFITKEHAVYVTHMSLHLKLILKKKNK